MKKDNFDVYKWNNMQKMANIINESQSTEYTVDDFILQNDGKDFSNYFLMQFIKTKLN